MLRVYLGDFKRFIPLLFSLTSRDFKLKYRRSILGVLWSILNPLLIMIVMTSVFTLLLRVQPTGMPFAVYYITGSTLYNFFTEATSGSMSSILGNSSLIKKVYIPKYMFPLEKCMFAFINMLFSMIAVVLVFGFYIITDPQEVSLHWTIFLIFIPMIFTFLFSVGVSLILSALTVFFRDMLHLWGVIITIWLYMTPIIYPVEILQNSGLTWIVKLNPLYYFIDSFRQLMILGTIPSLTNFLVSFLSCLVLLIVGGLIFRKAQDRFIMHI